jgi:FkbM family methyltransferase
MGVIMKSYYIVRRHLLKKLVPEFIWPKEVNIDGVLFNVRNTPYTFGTKRALVKGDYEVFERKLMKSQIQIDDVVFEMGGSIGVLTKILSESVGSGGKVYSVEASEVITSYSKEYLEKNGNITVCSGFGFPVFSVENKIKIQNFDDSSGPLGGVVSFENNDQEESNESKNNIYDIKKLMEISETSPTVLVIDIEGSEKILLDYKPNYPKSVRMVLIEMHTNVYGEVMRDKIIQNIVDDGFKVELCQQDVYLLKRQ